MLALAAAGLGALGGCAADMHRPCAERRTPTEEGAGSTWSLVFNSPGVTRAYAGVDPGQFDEFSRNDAALGPRSNSPVLATSQWPEPDRPELAYSRRLFLENRADRLLYFETESRYHGAYRYSPRATHYYWP